jgi:hypothetical protein
MQTLTSTGDSKAAMVGMTLSAIALCLSSYHWGTANWTTIKAEELYRYLRDAYKDPPEPSE